MRRYVILALFVLPLFAALSTAQTLITFASSPPTCGLASPAFCDTFDQPMGTGNRSGALDGTVWGVSRLTTNGNPLIPYTGPEVMWLTSQQQQCGSVVPVLPETDVNVCNGQMVESVYDGGTINADGSGESSNFDTILASYPKQPFDFAGRTGKVTFDVNADSAGAHGAWPALVITDKPVPAPGQDNDHVPAMVTTAENSFGFSLADNCDGAINSYCQNCPNTGDAAVDHAWVTSEWVETNLTVSPDGCVATNTHEAGPGALNHFELDISPTGFVLYGTDAGSTTLKQIASASQAMPLTRGLIWLEDIHYNGDKFCGEQPGNQYYPIACQGDHTFAWDNVGFDGPVLPRDLSFDVLDSGAGTAPSAGTEPIGWFENASAPATVETLPVGAADIGNASAALITLNWFPTSVDSITYAVNGHTAHTQAWPFLDGTSFAWRTYALSVSLSELQVGANTFAISTSDTAAIANIDLKLVGAGGVPSCFDPSDCAGSQFGPPPTVCNQAYYRNNVLTEGSVITCPS